MIKFIKDSIRELKHVVWPTREENINYFITVLSVLILFGIYIFIASTFFTKTLFWLKDTVWVKTEVKKVVNTKSNDNFKLFSWEAKIKTSKTKKEESKKAVSENKQKENTTSTKEEKTK